MDYWHSNVPLKIMLLTEHNLIADALAHINPHWDDERIFQEARRVAIAEFQHISYYEWLPIFLGQKNMRNNGLIYETTPGSYVNDYDSSIDPRVINAFATAAFRYFHTQIEGRLDLLSEHRARTASLRLSDWLNRPVVVEAEFDNLCRGMVTQPEEDTDDNLDTEIKHFLFRLDNPIGQDLKAIDIQRNRDHGLASYNDFREFCGLKRATTFEDFLDLISPRHVEKLRAHYTSPEDVDLTVGGSLEAHVAGALAGPTFLCILTEQFFRTRKMTDKDVACPHVQFGAPAEQLTEVTAFMDLSLVYGNSDQMNAGLRTFSGGRMITEQRHGREWPPQNPNASTVCTMSSGNEPCYLAGDSRVNQNPGLTSLQ
uniref:Uncharacterized protein n=1 Tax=Phlebotomus papatasi TaxID=29031 RepID=A0A1B0DME4_PHLPP